jgi:rubrerythrin
MDDKVKCPHCEREFSTQELVSLHVQFAHMSDTTRPDVIEYLRDSGYWFSKEDGRRILDYIERVEAERNAAVEWADRLKRDIADIHRQLSELVAAHVMDGLLIYVCSECGYITRRDKRRCHICGKDSWLVTSKGMEAAEALRRNVLDEMDRLMELRVAANKRKRT